MNREVNVLSYTHFTLEDRRYLQQLLSEEKSFREIAALMDRSPSSISREVRRNKSQYRANRKTDNPYCYNHWRAQCNYITRRRQQGPRALLPGSEEWNYVIKGLEKTWTPEEIAGRWHLKHPQKKPLSVSTIYRYIYKKIFPKITAKDYLRQRGKRRQTRNANYNTIHPDRIIPEWPDEIRNRERIGDWEGDTMYGGVGKGLLATAVDRKSRITRAGLLESRNALLVKDTMCKMLEGLPVHSISLDNGSEFAEFRALEQELGTKVYFAEPHKPWQRGTNENTNGLLRFFFPKGFDFRTITQEDVDAVVDLLNNRPRKCLGWKTPAEVFYEEWCCT